MKIYPRKNKLINIITDIDELYPIGPRKETSAERTIDSNLTSVLRIYSLQQ
jgi:hypothetical protein